MKKLLAMLLAAAILLSLCACGSSEKEAEAHPEENRTPDVQEDVQATTTSGEKIYELGETIVTADGMVELTVDAFTFSKYVNMETLKSGVEGGENTKTAPDGETILIYTATIKYVGDGEETWEFGFVPELDYDNGHVYNRALSCIYEGGSDFDRSLKVEFDRNMENKSAEARGYIYALEEAVERDSKGALLLVIDFFGSCDALGTYDEYPKIIVRLR